MQTIAFWIFIAAIFAWSIRYDLGIMDYILEKGIYKDKLLTEIRKEKASRKSEEP